MKFGALISPKYKPSELIKIVRHLEKLNFSSFWYPDEKFFRDCYIGLSLAALNSTYIRLGPCVTDPFSRHPIMTAAAVGSLAEIAPNRIWLGLGAGGRGFHAMNIKRERPSLAIKEAVYVIRRLLAGDIVDYQGEVIRVNRRALDFSPPQRIKIMIGTGYGRYVKQMAGEIADAVMLANCASPSTIKAGIKWISLGAKRVKRSLLDIEMISRVDVAVHDNGDLARAVVTPKILSAIRASYPKMEYLEDLPEFEMSSKLIRVIQKKDYKSRTYYADPKNCVSLITRSLINHMAIAGTPIEVFNQIEEIISLNIFNEIAICPVPCDGQSIIDLLNLIYDLIAPKGLLGNE